MAKKKEMAPRFTREQRADAVRMLEQGDATAAQVAESLGVTERTLRRWRARFEDEEAVTPLTRDERAELKRLRKELAREKRANEILKKFRAFVEEHES